MTRRVRRLENVGCKERCWKQNRLGPKYTSYLASLRVHVAELGGRWAGRTRTVARNEAEMADVRDEA